MNELILTVRAKLCFAAISLMMVSAPVQSVETALNNEKQLLGGFELIQQQSFDKAFHNIQSLTNDSPEYKLAQLMKADLYAIKAGKSDWIKQYRQANPKTVKSLLSEAKVRWQHFSQQQVIEDPLLSHYVLKSSHQPYLVIVNTDAHRLHLYKRTDQGYQQVVNYYVSIGRKGTGKQYRGDLKTPIGVYHVVQELSDKELPELYGVAALTLNYPNTWDKQNGRTGSGIWLHGTPRTTYSRPPLASRGCVVLNNPAMSTLIEQFKLLPDTPVIIADSAQLQAMNESLQQQKQQVLTQVNQWLRVQQNYQVEWSQVGVFQYPGEKDLFYVSFLAKDEQGTKLVEQFWHREFKNNGQLVLKTQKESAYKLS